ncbi:MAG: hypothetical protein K2K12_05360 [Clostridia bacterium]|nr:hypothetical protein [Clostridia bacterium]
MKKLGKFLMVGAIAAIAVAGTVGLTACGGSGYTGEYHYNNHDTEYGVKVKVEIEKNSENILLSTIKSVTIVNSDYVQLSPANETYGWTEEMRQNYSSKEADLLKAYEGKGVMELANPTLVTTNSVGEPSAVADTDLLITGATQSSGRLLLAVQDAINDWAEANKEAILEATLGALGGIS